MNRAYHARGIRLPRVYVNRLLPQLKRIPESTSALSNYANWIASCNGSSTPIHTARMAGEQIVIGRGPCKGTIDVHYARPFVIRKSAFFRSKHRGIGT